jgi:hypothetical protein
MQANIQTIAESAEFDRWFRAINRTRRASGARPRTRSEALVIWLAAA